MATAQDYNAVSRGLDSITQAVLGNFMARRAREQQEEEKRRFDQQRADQLAAEVAMRQLRERQIKLAEDQAKAQADARAATAAFQKETLAQRNRAGLEKTQAAADAAGLQRAFMGQFNGDSAAEPVNYDEAIGATTAPRLDITKPEDVLRAAQRVPGAMTPQQLAEIALRNQVATAKAAPEAAKNIEPVLKDYDVGNGQKLKVLYNPATGAHTLVKDPVQNKVAIRDVLAVRSALQKNTARMQELLAVPPENFGLPERREYKSLQEDNTFLNNLIGPVIEGEGVAPGQPAAGAAPAPAPAPKADFNYVPGVGLQRPGAPAVAPAPTPPDIRDQDAAPVAPPVAPQPPKPEPALRLGGFNRPAEVTPTPSRAGYTAERRTADRVAAITQELTAARTRLAEAQSGKKGAFMDRSAQAKLVDQAEKLFAELVQLNPEAARQFAQ